MKKTTTRIVYAGMFLTAALVLGQKMFMENRVIDDARVYTHPGSAGSVIAGGHGRNMSDVEDSVKITGIDGGIGNFSVDGDSILFISEDSVYENEDQSGGNGYGNTTHNAGNSEKITSSHNRNDSSSIYAGPAGGAVTYPSGSGRVGRLPAGENRNGAGGLGGGGGGWGGNGAGGKGNTDKDPAGNAPGANTGTTPDQENAAPAHEDKNDSERDNKPNGDHSAADGKEAASPADTSPDNEDPSYFNAPPGTPSKEPGDPFQPQIPAEEIGNQDHEGPGTSGNPGTRAIPEPASSLLIGLGSMMLLWSRRRSSCS